VAALLVRFVMPVVANKTCVLRVLHTCCSADCNTNMYNEVGYSNLLAECSFSISAELHVV
jgi:hypothetical protein